MKKRNRLLSSSQQSKLFKSESLSPHKNRHITILSLLALTGIFITGIVLATSEPSATTSQTLPVQLPNMPDNAESTTSALETSIKLPSPTSSESSPSADIVSIQEEQPVTTNAALQESAEIERLHLNQPKAVSENESDITILNDALSESPADNVTASDELSWQEVEVKSGDNLSLIFPRVGLTARDVYLVAQTAGDDAKALLNLKPGQVLRFGTVTDNKQKLELKQLQLQLSPMKTLTLTSTEKGFETDLIERELDKHRQLVAGEIQSSLLSLIHI